MPVVKPIVAKNELHAVQQEAIANYIQYAQSPLELEFGEKLQTRDFRAIIYYFIYLKHWTQERTVGALTGYMMFLFLISVYHPQYRIIPIIDVDELWHTHIFLNTNNYDQDCQKLFGYYLDHAAHISLEETEEYDSQAAFANTLILLEKHFGSAALVKLANTNSLQAATSGPVTAIFPSSSCGPMVFRN
ncbi:MAG: hypothetical protein RLZZ507_2117 [Cyanobacteriota bacterium]|jgi:hypothetical protein